MSDPPRSLVGGSIRVPPFSNERESFKTHSPSAARGALVGRDAGAPQVVQSPQDVVVPARGERNLGPRRFDSGLAVRSDDLSGRSRSEQAALEEVLLSAKASASDVGPRTLRRLVFQQSFEHTDRRV